MRGRVRPMPGANPSTPRSPGTMKRPISVSGRTTRRLPPMPQPRSIWYAAAKPNHSNSPRPVSDMNRRLALIRTFALAFAIACAALPTPLLFASQVVSPTGAPITLDVSKGLIIRLDRPCSSVFVADPDIADVQLKSPTVLYGMGKGAGSTTLYAVDAQDAVLLNSRIEVHQDVDRLARDIHQIDPSGRV